MNNSRYVYLYRIKHFIYILGFLPSFLFSQIPPGYYNSAQGLTGNNLKVALHNIIKNHTVISYSSLWQAFPKTDKKANGKVWDIYSYNPTGAQPYEYTFITNQCGSYNSESDCYNREHSWPQSWFNSVSGPDSDLFHIYPTDGQVNGERGNYPYGNVSNASWTSMNGGKLGPCTNAGYSSTVFEPINEFKGDLARGYFYMTTRYYSEDATWSSSSATSKADILPWQMTVLLSWHHQDPVSQKEIARNDSIYKIQNNRNPFIDHPDWADSAWLAISTVYERQAEAFRAFSLYPNPAENSFYIAGHAHEKKDPLCVVTDISGAVIFEKKISVIDNERIDCTEWAKGIYFVNVTSEDHTTKLRLVKL